LRRIESVSAAPELRHAVMLVEALRQRDFCDEQRPKGLPGGLAGSRLSAALTNIHGDVPRDWTVAGLAGLAASIGMSRAAFARRFKDTVGVAPMEYLLSWRLALAKDALLHSEKLLAQIAKSIGYQSASAFGTALAGIPSDTRKIGQEGVVSASASSPAAYT